MVTMALAAGDGGTEFKASRWVTCPTITAADGTVTVKGWVKVTPRYVAEIVTVPPGDVGGVVMTGKLHTVPASNGPGLTTKDP